MIHKIGNKELVFGVKSFGAELTSLRSTDGFEYLWQGSPDSWNGRSPILFPIIGGLQNNRYSLDGREYGMASHGFARKKEWKLTEQSGSSLVFTLESDDETLALYPFRFKFRMSYSLHGPALEVSYKIENKDRKDMPFSVGGHPGFRCPLEEGCSFEDYHLRFTRPEKTLRHIKEGKLLTGKTEAFELPDGILKLNYETFRRGAVILSDFASDSIILERQNDPETGRAIRMDFPGFTHLGLWTFPDSPQPYICIEPWFGMDSTSGRNSDENLRTKAGMKTLIPGEIFTSTFSLTIR